MTPGSDEVSLVGNSRPFFKIWTRRALGIGLGIYVLRTFVKSRVFQQFLNKVLEWKNIRPSDEDLMAAGALDVHPVVNGESFPVSILEMDPCNREHLWELLSNTDIRTLNLMLEKFNAKLSSTFDLYVDVDCCNRQQLDWTNRKSIQSCAVSHLEHTCSWAFLGRPQALHELSIGPTFFISSKNLEDILDLFVNLLKLSMHVRNRGIRGHKEEWSMLQVLGRKPTLDVLQIFSFEGSHWILEFDPDNPNVETRLTTNQKVEFSLGNQQKTILPHPRHLNIQFPEETRPVWQTFLECQSRLKYFILDCSPTPWSILAKVILQNSLTLERVHLVNIVHWDEPVFDWNVFTSSRMLTCLTLLASTEKGVGPTEFKPLCPSHSLTLTSLELDLGKVPWTCYDSIVKSSAASLNTVILFRLENVKDEKFSSEFDFSMFKYCHNLSLLSLSGRDFQFLPHKNLTSLPRSIAYMDFKWFTFTTQQLEFLAQNFPNFYPDPRFMKLCSITGFVTEKHGSPALFIDTIRNNKTGLERICMYLNACPVSIVDTALTLYLLLA